MKVMNGTTNSELSRVTADLRAELCRELVELSADLKYAPSAVSETVEWQAIRAVNAAKRMRTSVHDLKTLARAQRILDLHPSEY